MVIMKCPVSCLRMLKALVFIKISSHYISSCVEKLQIRQR